MSDFFRELVTHYKKRRAARWFVVTFHKTTGLLFLGIIGVMVYYTKQLTAQASDEQMVRTLALHTDNAMVRTNGMLIYDGKADKQASASPK